MGSKRTSVHLDLGGTLSLRSCFHVRRIDKTTILRFRWESNPPSLPIDNVDAIHLLVYSKEKLPRERSATKTSSPLQEHRRLRRSLSCDVAFVLLPTVARTTDARSVYVRSNEGKRNE